MWIRKTDGGRDRCAVQYPASGDFDGVRGGDAHSERNPRRRNGGLFVCRGKGHPELERQAGRPSPHERKMPERLWRHNGRGARKGPKEHRPGLERANLRRQGVGDRISMQMMKTSGMMIVVIGTWLVCQFTACVGPLRQATVFEQDDLRVGIESDLTTERTTPPSANDHPYRIS